MGLIFILLQFIIVTDQKVQIIFSIHDALTQTTNIITFKLCTLFKFTLTLDNNTGEMSGSALFSSLPLLTARQYLLQLTDPVMSDPTVKNTYIYN